MVINLVRVMSYKNGEKVTFWHVLTWKSGTLVQKLAERQ